jgi:hypothetical protein
VRGCAVLAVVSFIALRGSMVILSILVFVMLSFVDRSSLDLAFKWLWVALMFNKISFLKDGYFNVRIIH